MRIGWLVNADNFERAMSSYLDLEQNQKNDQQWLFCLFCAISQSSMWSVTNMTWKWRGSFNRNSPFRRNITQALVFEVSDHSPAPSLGWTWLMRAVRHSPKHCSTVITFKEWLSVKSLNISKITLLARHFHIKTTVTQGCLICNNLALLPAVLEHT
jgi:hypothetical protein